jgi:2-iminobutanoate/2-iminopropanoate deaminase
MKRTITSPKAPGALGPYSPALAHGRWLFLSGQLGLDPNTRALAAGDFAAQAQQAFQNLNELLYAAERKPSDVVRLTVYLVNLKDVPTLNRIQETFYSDPYPTRSLMVCHALPKGALVEIDAMAMSLHEPKI